MKRKARLYLEPPRLDGAFETLLLATRGVARDVAYALMTTCSYLAQALDAAEQAKRRHVQAALASTECALKLTRQFAALAQSELTDAERFHIGQLLGARSALILGASRIGLQLTIPSDVRDVVAQKLDVQRVLDDTLVRVQSTLLPGAEVTLVLRNTVLSSANPAGLSAGRYVEIAIAHDCLAAPRSPARAARSSGVEQCRLLLIQLGGGIAVESTSGREVTLILLPSV